MSLQLIPSFLLGSSRPLTITQSENHIVLKMQCKENKGIFHRSTWICLPQRKPVVTAGLRRRSVIHFVLRELQRRVTNILQDSAALQYSELGTALGDRPTLCHSASLPALTKDYKGGKHDFFSETQKTINQPSTHNLCLTFGSFGDHLFQPICNFCISCILGKKTPSNQSAMLLTPARRAVWH